MADNYLKTPLGTSLNRLSVSRAQDAIKLTGRALPARLVSRVGMIVTVAFEVTSNYTLPEVTIPLAGSEYAREPLQVGCQGVVIPADVYLGGISGLGGGTAGLAQPGNLTALVFQPVGNTAFQSVDPDVYTIYGPAGVTLRDSTAASLIELTPTSITLSVGGHSIIINSSGVTIDGKVFLAHEHTGVATGSNNTGGVF